jgi:hypothetical protein
MEYQISSFDGGTVIQDWTICNEPQTEIFLSDHNIGYQVVVRQRTNHAINEHFRIRSAPQVAFHKKSNVHFVFYIYDLTQGIWRAVKTEDNIQLLRSSGGSWTDLHSSVEFHKLNTDYVYARYAAGDNSETDGITYSDPASFPRRVTTYQ